MTDAEQTTRERIAERLREGPASASDLAEGFTIPTDVAIDHVRHVAATLDGTDEQVVVAPPECRDCGFDGFDDPANRPSRCPECKSESLDEPTFAIEAV
ncbi:transcriptional regulator [Salinarchaeum chitinilyticum]